MSKNLILAIDCGISGVKTVGGKGEIMFESILLPKPNSIINFGGSFGIENPFELTYDDQIYLLGDHAKFVNVLNPITFANHGAGGSKNSEYSVIKALGGVCEYLGSYEDFANDTIDVHAIFGSPLINATNSEEVRAIEDRFLNNGKPFEINYNGINLKIRFKNIKVMPEGAAAYYSVIFKSKNTYIVDAGSQTINLIAFMDGIANPMAANTLTNGVEYFKHNYPRIAAKMLAKTILAEAERLKWAPGSILYVCGGYALELSTAFAELENNPYTMELIRPELSLEGKKGAKKSLDPIYANAVGMFYIARQVFAQELVG